VEAEDTDGVKVERKVAGGGGGVKESREDEL